MFEYSDESIEEIETDFPKLRGGRYRIASSQDKKYNCIAFAAGDINRYWQNLGHPMKGYFWPPGLTDDETIDGWMRAFRLLNYEVTNTADPEIGFEKIAIYGTQEGTALHVAIRKDSGPWMS